MLASACQSRTKTNETPETTAMKPGTFSYDLNFLQQHKQVVVLGTRDSPARVIVIPEYQARVMTSTADGDEGMSYGWVNYDLIQSGDMRAHMNPFGGEDRFWLGPEGGQYAIFFPPGVPFDFEYWQTPALIDSEPFKLVSRDTVQATFRRSALVTNYQGFEFNIDINRQIQLLSTPDLENELNVPLADVKVVGYQSINTVSNTGDKAWSEDSGLLSIWILGMFNPSPETIIILPHQASQAGVTDDYFGKIPEDRLHELEDVLVMKGDGRFRGKVGIAPDVASPIVGSYDRAKGLLTLVKFDLHADSPYVNSKWEIQKHPYQGDAVNAYNDGPLEDGSQLGPFYELESSSPARALKPGEVIMHRHLTVHIEGTAERLNDIAQKTLGVALSSLR